MVTATQASAAEILAFWFSERVRPLWFNSTAAFDDELRTRFEPAYLAAKAGELDAWRDNPEGSLALCILFDQFPLNMYRGKPDGFATEAAAREVARLAIEAGHDRQVDDQRRAFYYLPFMHSEDLVDQDYSVSLFESAGMKENLRYAHHHRDIVKRFGRFPHRNAILGRVNTADEAAYLASPEAFHG